MKKREKANLRIVHLLKPGTKIRAIYADEDNDPSWYDAVINSVEVGAYDCFREGRMMEGGREGRVRRRWRSSPAVRRQTLVAVATAAAVRGCRVQPQWS